MARDPGPAIAAVDGLEKPAAGAFERRVLAPYRAPGIPQGGIDHPRIGGIESQVHGARVGSAIQHLLPGASAVRGAEYAALRVGRVGMAEDRHVDPLRVSRVNPNAGDLARIAQADVGPGLAGVHGFVDAVAEADLGADIGLAGAHVENIRVGGRHGNRSDGGDALLVEDRRPHRAGVGGLPNSAAYGAEVESHGIARDASDGRHAPTAKRTDHAPLQLVIEAGGNGLRGQGGERAEKEEQA